MPQDSQANILIIGQGDIGCPVTNTLAERGYQVTGLARGEKANYQLHPSANYTQADALTLKAEQLSDFTHLAIIVTPDQYDIEAYKNTYLGIAQHIADLSTDLPKLERVVFISSTGVYGQNDGEWIDEFVAPKTALRETSDYILQAEQALQKAFAERAAIIRPSGIYGKERLMRVRKARELNKPPMPQYDWSNRIMDTDLINIIANVMTLSNSEIKPIYLATDYAPVTTYEMAKWFGEKMDTSVPEISDATTVSGKRLHSNIPLAWLEYPDWQSGYSMILQYL